jgi:hypothetical protein
MPWKATGRCEIGVSHHQRGLPCQDYCDVRIIQNVLVGVVADGAGSCAASDLGAFLTVQACMSFMDELDAWLAQEQRQAYRPSAQPLPRKVARILFQKVVQRALGALQDAAQEKQCNLDDLSCTLLMFIATPDWIAAMQIGDGLLVIRPQEADYQLIFLPDKGEFANQTTFVTAPDALESMQVQVLAGKMQFVSAMTDGLESVAIRYSDWSPFAPFFDPLQRYMTENHAAPVETEDYLQLFLSSARLNQKTSDDKSLILGLYEPDCLC